MAICRRNGPPARIDGRMRATRANVRIDLAASRCLRIAVLLLTVLAMSATWMSRFPEALIALPPLLAWSSWRRIGKGFPLRLILHGDGSAVCLDARDDEFACVPLAFHERGPLGVLVLEKNGHRQHVPWAFDSLTRSHRREIRLWLARHASLRPSSKAPDAQVARG